VSRRGGQGKHRGGPGDPAPDRPVVAGRLRPRGTEMQVTVDCDVLQPTADADRVDLRCVRGAARRLSAGCRQQGCCGTPPLTDAVAAVSVRRHRRAAWLDLPYSEIRGPEVDMNVVMTGSRPFRRGAGHGRGSGFSRGELDQLLELAEGRHRPAAHRPGRRAGPAARLAVQRRRPRGAGVRAGHREPDKTTEIAAILGQGVALRLVPLMCPRWSRTARPSSTTLG